MSAVTNYVNNMGMEVVWDEETCQNYASKQVGDAFYEIWMEDEASLEVKLNVMNTFDIGGVAAWRLGYETSSAWDLISKYVAQ
jgi:spore germination protein YaaH